MATDLAARAKTIARRTEPKDGFDVAGRVGLATQGVLYLVVALLAIQVAQGDPEQVDKDGAIEAVARQPFGHTLVILLAVGLGLNALWRFSLAVRGDGPSNKNDAKQTAKRVANVARGLLYTSFTYVAIRVATHNHAGGGEKEQQATADVLGWPGGRGIVIVAGLAFIAGGLFQWRQPFTRSFLDKLRTGSMSRRARRVVEIVGSVGFAARGVVFALVGAFAVRAAWTYDPQEAKGIDGALKELAASSSGPALLGALACGLLAFGVFRLVDAAYREDDFT